jgi:cytochrome c oxidase subunit II
MAKPVPKPATPEAHAGERAFAENGCDGCHAIRGTEATGDVGPDLTHLATRTTIAGAILPNTPSQLRAWIRDPQHFKPGAKMPGLPLSDAELDELVAYLEGLR